MKKTTLFVITAGIALILAAIPINNTGLTDVKTCFVLGLAGLGLLLLFSTCYLTLCISRQASAAAGHYQLLQQPIR
ncbi:hypothetical protein [Chitinophaga nivalis]|uniref:Uncharacterized protein n=1 Tax=Chitinophaga nivalis TaxID=2991709 RepID=A0ABT3IT82_9BACT|nr:hypothetical protein [Chitinophaga nivalis]MCW3463127.1 hypothetical protein [Chitinophaga nivalis]MCW3487183.1 hypothetical protein [Chitinophaga nivalis]